MCNYSAYHSNECLMPCTTCVIKETLVTMLFTEEEEINVHPSLECSSSFVMIGHETYIIFLIFEILVILCKQAHEVMLDYKSHALTTTSLPSDLW